MALQASYSKKIFRFNFKARTSRGLMEDKVSWFIKLWDDAQPQCFGIGECGPLPGLSPDAIPDFENVLDDVLKRMGQRKIQLPMATATPIFQPFQEIIPPHFPSITFGMETAWLDLLHGGKRVIFENDFLEGKSILINGLIWMGDLDFMMRQIHEKITQGFQCIKLKVGSLDFEQECGVIRAIREQYSLGDITIRLDANGAFRADEAMFKLQRLSEYHIHSIEQPIKEGQVEMEHLCQHSPIPIALDEELIRCESTHCKKQLLERIKPAYIILKPTLHGGFSGCQEWIALAENLGIEWWITSALESNIGLNAICQFTATYHNSLPQGLGTGGIYQNNIESPIRVANGHIFLDNSKAWELAFLSLT